MENSQYHHQDNEPVNFLCQNAPFVIEIRCSKLVYSHYNTSSPNLVSDLNVQLLEENQNYYVKITSSGNVCSPYQVLDNLATDIDLLLRRYYFQKGKPTLQLFTPPRAPNADNSGENKDSTIPVLSSASNEENRNASSVKNKKLLQIPTLKPVPLDVKREMTTPVSNVLIKYEAKVTNESVKILQKSLENTNFICEVQVGEEITTVNISGFSDSTKIAGSPGVPIFNYDLEILAFYIGPDAATNTILEYIREHEMSKTQFYYHVFGQSYVSVTILIILLLAYIVFAFYVYGSDYFLVKCVNAYDILSNKQYTRADIFQLVFGILTIIAGMWEILRIVNDHNTYERTIQAQNEMRMHGYANL